MLGLLNYLLLSLIYTVCYSVIFSWYRIEVPTLAIFDKVPPLLESIYEEPPNLWLLFEANFPYIRSKYIFKDRDLIRFL